MIIFNLESGVRGVSISRNETEAISTMLGMAGVFGFFTFVILVGIVIVLLMIVTVLLIGCFLKRKLRKIEEGEGVVCMSHKNGAGSSEDDENEFKEEENEGNEFEKILDSVVFSSVSTSEMDISDNEIRITDGV